jgi:5'(3')-deoxyribonucleotidase
MSASKEIFNSEEFWEKVEIREGIEDLLKDEEIREKYDIYIGSKGTSINLLKKRNLLRRIFPGIPFIGIGMNESKGNIGISPMIQIDDNYFELSTTAPLKILLCNNLSTNYNYHNGEVKEDLYIINTIEELGSILRFYAKNEQELKVGER